MGDISDNLLFFATSDEVVQTTFQITGFAAEAKGDCFKRQISANVPGKTYILNEYCRKLNLVVSTYTTMSKRKAAPKAAAPKKSKVEDEIELVDSELEFTLEIERW
jgi:hypothetical protein